MLQLTRSPSTAAPQRAVFVILRGDGTFLSVYDALNQEVIKDLDARHGILGWHMVSAVPLSPSGVKP